MIVTRDRRGATGFCTAAFHALVRVPLALLAVCVPHASVGSDVCVVVLHLHFVCRGSGSSAGFRSPCTRVGVGQRAAGNMVRYTQR